MAVKYVTAITGAALFAAAAPAQQSADSLGWMAGNWAVEQPDGGWTEEMWMAPRGGMIVGLGRTGMGATVKSWELMRIAPDANGVPTCYASPDGEGPYAFALKEAGPNSFTCERAGAEFPLRVHYVRTGDTLVATISGPGDESHGWTFSRKP